MIPTLTAIGVTPSSLHADAISKLEESLFSEITPLSDNDDEESWLDLDGRVMDSVPFHCNPLCVFGC